MTDCEKFIFALVNVIMDKLVTMVLDTIGGRRIIVSIDEWE